MRIPIRAEARSLNLGNSAAIGVFEALRQQGFPHLKAQGKMDRLVRSRDIRRVLTGMYIIQGGIWMNYNKKSVEDIDVAGKRVLCRCDFNVPTKDGKITSDKRIVAALPTIEYLIKHGARVILCSHMGKPKGEIRRPSCSLQVVADRLSELLGQPVEDGVKDVVGESAQSLAASLKDGEVMLLENTRFEKGETKNDPELSKKLASLADIFVNDAFGTAHRAHASTAGVADYLPAVCGYLVQKEVSIMGKALADPERPFVAILGGAKVSDKLNVINNLLEKVDTLIIGGGMAYTFLAAKGYGIGKSLFDAEKVDYCQGHDEEGRGQGRQAPAAGRHRRRRRISRTRSTRRST